MYNKREDFGEELSTRREKRGIDSNNEETNSDNQSESKRPKLASVIVETLKKDSLQKLCSSLEPILRRVVSEEVERALAKLGPGRLGERSPLKQLEGPDGRNLQLHFKSRLSLPLFTGGKVEGEQGTSVHVVLIDVNNGHIVTSGPESSAKLDLVVLEGDFNNENDDGWTEQEFESHIVKEREGKRPLLTGELQISLKEGIGTLGELTFTDNSSWIRSRKFRLGLKTSSGFCERIRVREAKTEAFTVKDHRGELYKKHYPPALKDEVWRLEKIGKDGSFHKRLNKSGILTVEDFLQLVVKDSQRLRNILGSGMSTKMWDILVDHAKTCVLSGKHYIYYSDEARSTGAVFNNIYEFIGLIASGQYFSAECFTDSQKGFVDTLVKKAYDNWMHVVEYDDKALLDFKQKNNASDSVKKVSLVSSSYSSSYDQQTSSPVSSMQPPLVAEVLHGGSIPRSGYNTNQLNAYISPPQHITSNSNVQYDEGASFIQQNLIISPNLAQFTRTDSTELALAPAHPQTYNNISTYNDYFSSEEEIRSRSHEMLENEDMQQLLQVLSMSGSSSSNNNNNNSNINIDGGFDFSSYLPSPSPNFNIDEGRSKPSGKAVVGWLKIKAAMRWGIFVRKKAAERRRAQLIELED